MNKDAELPQQRPVQVPRYVLEAQDAVKSLVEGARVEAAEHLAAMKQKHMELVRQRFYDSLEERIFRLDALKPQPTLGQKPCRGSILICFHIPKSYLNRPVYYKPIYINHQNNCNHLPYNSFKFHECMRRSLLLSTNVTVRPTSEASPKTTSGSFVKSTHDLNTYDEFPKEIMLSTTIKSYYDSPSTESSSFDYFQKLDNQKTSIRLENEILGIGDLENPHSLITTSSTGTQSSTTNKPESVVLEYIPETLFVNARNEPESSTTWPDRHESTTPAAVGKTIDASSNNDVNNPTLSIASISSTVIAENRENVNVDDSSPVTNPTTIATTSLTSIPPDVTTIDDISKESKYIEPSELHNESREDNIKEYTTAPFELESRYLPSLSSTNVPNEIHVDTQVTEMINKEKPTSVEQNTGEDSTETYLISTSQGRESSLLETTLNRHYEVTTPEQNKDFGQQSNIPESTHMFISGTDSTIQTSSDTSEIEIQQSREEVIPKTEHLEPTTNSISTEDWSIALKTDTTGPYTEANSNKENVHLSKEYTTNSFKFDTYSVTKGKGIVRAQPTHSNQEDIHAAYEYNQPFLDIQDKLLPNGPDNAHMSISSDHTTLEYAREFTTIPSSTILNKETDDIAKTFDGINLPEQVDIPTVTNPTKLDVAYNKSRTDGEVIDTPSHIDDRDSSISSIHLPQVFATSTSKITPNEILKFTDEIEFESTSIDRTISEAEISSTPLDLNLSDEPNIKKGIQHQRMKRSSEDKPIEDIEVSSISSSNTSDVNISPTQYASTILELLPVIREGFKNNAFSDEDKKAISSIFGEMKPWLDEESLKNIKESGTDLLMGDETLRTDDLEDYSDYDSSDSQERRLKRSKNIRLLTSLIGNIPKRFQRDITSSSLLRQIRKIRSPGPPQVSEAAAILALLAENGEGVQLDRADDDDDDEYEYYEDDEADEDSSDEDVYKEEYDDNPSFVELIKLARKHRERKAME